MHMNFPHFSKSRQIAGAIILGTCLFVSGCSFQEVKKDVLEKTGISKALHESPLSLQFAAEIPSQNHLYELQNDLFIGKPYNDLYRFGDNLLLVGEANYSAVLNPASSLEEFKQNTAPTSDTNINDNYEFSFNLFSPWSNTYVTSLSHEVTNCTSYQVCGNNLLLFNADTHTLQIYDTNLDCQGTYDTNEIESKTQMDFHASNSDKKFYLTGSDDQSLWSVTLKKDSLSLDPLDFDYYKTTLGVSSPTGKRTVIQGISKDTLCNVLTTWNGDAFRTFGKFAYFDGAITDTALLTRCDSSGNYWFYQFDEDNGSYFYLPGVQKASLLPDNHILIQYSNGYSMDKPGLAEYAVYDTDGMKLSDFSYDFQAAKSTPQYLGNNFAYFEDIGIAYFLIYNSECEPSILIWDISGTVSSSSKPDSADSDDGWLDEEDLFEDSDFGSNSADDLIFYPSLYLTKMAHKNLQLTFPETVFADDWDNILQQRDILESLYGIEISFASEVPDTVGDYSVQPENNKLTIKNALAKLEDIFSCYPSGFLSQLVFGNCQDIHLLIASDLSGGNDDTLAHASGFVTVMDDQIILVLNTEDLTDWDYTVNHEISHMIDQRIAFYTTLNDQAMFSENTWNSLNPNGFAYADSYVDFQEQYTANGNSENSEPPLATNASGETYFVDDYGTTFATEDRAEIFGTIMSDYMNDFSEDPLFLSGSPLQKKMNYYAACIRDSFNTNGWETVLPWELMSK